MVYIVHVLLWSRSASASCAFYTSYIVPSRQLLDFALGSVLYSFNAQARSLPAIGCRNTQALKRLRAAIKAVDRPATVPTGRAAPVAQPSRHAAGPEPNA